MYPLIIRLLTGIALIFTFYSCKSTQTVIAPAPATKSFASPPAVKSSFVYLPLSLPVKRLNEVANTEIPKILFEEKGQPIAGGAKVSYRIERPQNLSVKPIKDGELDFAVPVKIIGRVEWSSPDKIGFKIGDLDLSTDVKKINLGKDFSFPYDLKFKTKLELTSDWNIHTQLLGRFDWGKAPKFEVGDYTLDFDRYVGTGLQTKLNGYVESFENKIKNAMDIKGRVQPAWNELAKPIQLYNDPPVWLQLTPEKVNFVTRENKNKDTLRWNLGIVTKLNTFIGTAPKPLTSVPLPQISNAETQNNRFFLHLPIRVTYQDLTQIAQQQLTAQEWDAGKYKVKFLQTQVKSDGEKLLIFLDLEAKKAGKRKLTKAKIWLQARPTYDPVTQTIKAEELDFDLQTKKALLNVADWLLHGFILKKAQEASQYNLKADMDNAKKQITQSLTNLEAGNYLIFNGKVEKLQFDNLYLTPDGIEVRALTEGRLEGKLK